MTSIIKIVANVQIIFLLIQLNSTQYYCASKLQGPMYCCVYVEQCDAGLIELSMLTQQSKIQTAKNEAKGSGKNNILKN